MCFSQNCAHDICENPHLEEEELTQETEKDVLERIKTEQEGLRSGKTKN